LGMIGRMDEIEVGGLRLAYERAGQGPPLVLLHGYVGDGPSTWREQIDGLSDEFTVVAWDCAGAGRSMDPPESFGLADLADVLAGAYAGWAGSLPPDVVAERLRQVLSDMPPDRFVHAVLPTMFSASVAAEVRDAFAMSVAGFHPVGLRVPARSFAEADLRDVLPRIAVPTLLLYGDEDVRAPMTVAEDIHRAIPGSKLVVMGGVGHVSSVEAGKRFTDEVREFLRMLPH
jgi:pimeloyl-ACP methyl ester carboxylesterase